MKVGRKADGPVAADETRTRKREPARTRGHDGPARKRRAADGPRAATSTRPSREPRGLRQGPATAPTPRPKDRAARPKTTTQAKARANARKAKAPKVVRPSLRERLIARLEGVDLRPRALLARIPFVMLVIGALALGLGITLWLSTASAQRSYQLGSARTVNDALSQQKETLERDVLEAQSAPALADAARNLGMIPSRDTAHLVQDPAGNWVVVGMPKPAPPPRPSPSRVPPQRCRPGSPDRCPARWLHARRFRCCSRRPLRQVARCQASLRQVARCQVSRMRRWVRRCRGRQCCPDWSWYRCPDRPWHRLAVTRWQSRLPHRRHRLCLQLLLCLLCLLLLMGSPLWDPRSESSR